MIMPAPISSQVFEKGTLLIPKLGTYVSAFPCSYDQTEQVWKVLRYNDKLASDKPMIALVVATEGTYQYWPPFTDQEGETVFPNHVLLERGKSILLIHNTLYLADNFAWTLL